MLLEAWPLGRVSTKPTAGETVPRRTARARNDQRLRRGERLETAPVFVEQITKVKNIDPELKLLDRIFHLEEQILSYAEISSRDIRQESCSASRIFTSRLKLAMELRY